MSDQPPKLVVDCSQGGEPVSIEEAAIGGALVDVGQRLLDLQDRGLADSEESRVLNARCGALAEELIPVWLADHPSADSGR